MSKKKIVLADNSYTIRRIVELSFSEEEGIQLLSFENGLNLKEKLLEIVPEIVLVDIKLPELNGYEVCKFINQTEAINKTKVFLMKGGFEPVNEELLKGLNYVDIITKPFDSNALVSSIKKVLSEMPAGAPASVPEDLSTQFPDALPEIDSFESQGEDISFSDIKEEMHADDLIGASDDPGTERYLRDEVLPSEEITVGAQPDREDKLRPENNGDDLFNPFQDDAPASPVAPRGMDQEELDIKENIKAQEKELQIASLTQEEINIKKYIEEKQLESQGNLNADAQPGFINDETTERPLVEDQLRAPQQPETDLTPEFDDMPPAGGPADDLDQFPGDFESNSLPETPSMPTDNIPQPQMNEFQPPAPPPEPPPMPPTYEEPEFPPAPEKIQPPHPPQPPQSQQPPQPPEPTDIPPMQQDLEEPTGAFFDDSFPKDFDTHLEKEEDFSESFAPPAPPTPDQGLNQFSTPPDVNDFDPGFQDPFEPPQVQPQPPIQQEPPAPPQPPIQSEPPAPPEPPIVPPMQQAPPPPPPAPPIETEQPPAPSAHEENIGIQKDELTKKIEDKLTLAIKEILWEIAPPLAEKLIREEIERIKAEIEEPSV